MVCDPRYPTARAQEAHGWPRRDVGSEPWLLAAVALVPVWTRTDPGTSPLDRSDRPRL